MTTEIKNREVRVNFALDLRATNHLVRQDIEKLMTDIKEINPVCTKVQKKNNKKEDMQIWKKIMNKKRQRNYRHRN